MTSSGIRTRSQVHTAQEQGCPPLSVILRARCTHAATWGPLPGACFKNQCISVSEEHRAGSSQPGRQEQLSPSKSRIDTALCSRISQLGEENRHHPHCLLALRCMK